MANKKNRPPVHTPQGGLPAQARPATSPTQILEVTGTAWSAPLPPPQILQGYDAISPGFAARIMEWAEAEGDHRRTLTSRQQIINSVLDAMGLLATTGVSAWALWLGATLLGAGHELGGFAALVTALVPFAGALAIVRKRKK